LEEELMKRRLCVLTVAVSLVFLENSVAHATPVSLPSATAMSFQNEGTLEADHTVLLVALDDVWAPSTSGTVDYDFYATGNGSSYWDAVSLTFDLSSIGWSNVASAELWFYAQQGNYFPPEWHHYEILQGAFNPTHQDVPLGMDPPIPDLPGIVDFGSHGNNGLVGWLAAPIPPTWITADQFDITLRLWNVRLDTVEFRPILVPAPGALLLGGLGALLVGGLRRHGSL
jgi:hypothetical protein